MKAPDDSLQLHDSMSDPGRLAIAKVKRINQRWIVHGRLREDTEAYLDHLEARDPARCQAVCELSLELVRHKRPPRDPKPYFYGGLFATATPEEIDRFLPDHPLTRTICRLLRGDAGCLDSLPPHARQLAGEIAREIGRSREVA